MSDPSTDVDAMTETGTNAQPEGLLDALRAVGLPVSEAARLTPLTGGVSSDIYRVDDGDRAFVVKRALDKLKVEADWRADTSRNRFEQAYLRYVAAFRPDAVPAILAADADAGVFAMEYLDGFRTWKQDLLAGEFDTSLAEKAGALLGEVHARSWGDPAVAAEFDALANFEELRVAPYLRATAEKHAALRAPILAEADRLARSQQCLIHGDYSPKNLLHRDGRLVVLDCEVACYADAGFDLAFLLNHLFLKALLHAPRGAGLRPMVAAARRGYRLANPDHADEVERGVARTLPMLLLARVDGKSPVEYLDATRQQAVRDFTHAEIQRNGADLDALEARWFDALLSHSDPSLKD